MRNFKRPKRRRLTIIDLVATVVVVIMILVAIFGPMLWGSWAAETDIANARSGPTSEHWLGTDALGRDILARTLVATRPSILLALLATLVGAGLGITLGALAAVMGPRVRRTFASVINILVAFPPLLLAIFFAVVFGIGGTGSVLAIAAAFTPGFARLTQTLAQSIAEREFVLQARILKKSRPFIIVRHILPNCGEPLLIYGTTHVGIAILALAGLGFLGFGVQPPSFDWGSLLSQGLKLFYLNPSVAIGPAVAIAIAGLAFNLVGERMADALAGRDNAGLRLSDTVDPIEATQVETAIAHRSEAALRVENLRVRYPVDGQWTTPVRDVSLTVGFGERIGVVGETGSGKSVMVRAISQLVDAPGVVEADCLEFKDESLTEMSNADLGGRIAMVFQDPNGSFNPSLRVGGQVREPAIVHRGKTKEEARDLAIGLLGAVSINDPARRYKQYPHELSGGMKQRASIAAGLVSQPDLLIADEPTTALDVTVQKQILELIIGVQEESNASLLLISHDIAVVSQVCDRILVMYAGFIVEDGPVQAVLESPAHPYTDALTRASPTMETAKDQPLRVIPGRVPSPAEARPGCYFADRCPRATELCLTKRPVLTSVEPRHAAACWHPITKPVVSESGEGEELTR